jgi:hypothetical protein
VNVQQQKMKLWIAAPSLWLAYDVTDRAGLQALLPSHLTLASVPVLAADGRRGGQPLGPKLLFNAYDLQAKWMVGHRVDVQTVAVDKRKGTVHLVVLDCLTNTLHWNPRDGVAWPNAVVTRPGAHTHDFALRVVDKPRTKRLEVRGARGGRYVEIGWRFAVEANRMCYFGDHPVGYSMAFSEYAIAKPVRPLRVAHHENSFWTEHRAEEPSHAFYHEHPMLFDVDVDDFR